MSRIPSHDQELLAHLAETPAWAALRKIGEERITSEYQRVTAALMRGDLVPDLDYRRGVCDGIRFLLRNPGLEAKKLEKLLAQERGDS